MKLSYTKSLIPHLLRLNLFLLIFVVINGCQIDQSVNLIKAKLFSDNEDVDNRDESSGIKKNKSEEKKILKKSFSNKDLKTTNYQKKDNEIKRKSYNTANELAFKEKGQGRDNESKIISFFTNFFDSEDEEISSTDETVNNEQFISKNDMAEVFEEIENVTEEKDIELGDTKNVETENTINEQIDLSDKTKLAEENNFKDNTKAIDEVDQEINSGNREFAFLQLKAPKKIIKEEEFNNVVGLLLPLTGKKSAAGTLVINSLRYSMLLKPNELNFKIFDTKGSPKGALDAAKQGIKKGVNTFIGPIFSDETKEVKEYFKDDDELIFFSLSPDFTNVSNNIIVSGQNPEEQVSCIIQKIAENLSSRILVIYHSDKYGNVVRDSFSKFSQNLGASRFAPIEFFEINDKMNLNDELKKVSRFDERKIRLKNEVKKVKLDNSIDRESKKKQISSLERKLTLDTPFDSVVIASQGDQLLEILSHLAFYDINSENTDIYGTSLWEDTDKKDNVYEGTFYVTSLKDKNDEFSKNFKDVFAKDPLSLNFYIHDLIGIVQNLKVRDNDKIINEVFYGEFSNSKIDSGLLQREIYVRKIRKNEKTEEISSCRLDEI